MIATLPLKEMSLKDKFMLIEIIWDDIIHNSADFPSPDWHAEILKERDAKLNSGEDKLIDWEVAKKQLRERNQY